MGSESDGNQYDMILYFILQTIYTNRDTVQTFVTQKICSGYFLFRFGSNYLQLPDSNIPSYALCKLEGHQDTLDIPHNKEQLMDNVEQMSARNIPDLSRTNHVTNMLVVMAGMMGVGLFT